jgi:hypothetical protein
VAARRGGGWRARMAALVPVYHEKQYGAMCGQHCEWRSRARGPVSASSLRSLGRTLSRSLLRSLSLTSLLARSAGLNNLLQGPYFCAEDLAEIALQLDAQEAQLLGTGAAAAGAASNNVDDSGNFSIQVLSEALRRAHGVTLDQDAKELAATLARLGSGGLLAADGDGQRPLAFVCNLREHWFAIRSLRGEVWNLNSLQGAPARISPGYLSVLLAQLREEGYSIFQARGAPLPVPLTDPQLGRREDWFVPGQDERRAPPRAPTGAASKGDPHIVLDDDEEAEDEQLRAALRESMREDVTSHGSREAVLGAAGDNLADFDDDDEQDDDLQAALALSMREHQAKLGRG